MASSELTQSLQNQYDNLSSGDKEMHIYSSLILMGIIGIALLAFSFFQMINIYISFALAVFAYIVFILITFINTRSWMNKEHKRQINHLKEKYESRIRRLKNEHDTAMLEKTIRNGTKTLIKNSVDYFKVENIKNEMPPSAAIQNLQLDKYGQIIELLADFSLILPDYDENRQIVLQEITHQIEIFQIDEKPFAEFLQTIMGKYLLTVNKKIREKIRQNILRHMKVCPQCSEKIPSDAKICKHCGHKFLTQDLKNMEVNAGKDEKLVKKGYSFYRAGNLEEAIKCFSLAITINPKSENAYYGRGFIYHKMDKFHEAMDDLQLASQMGNEKAKDFLNNIKFAQTQEYSKDFNQSS